MSAMIKYLPGGMLRLGSAIQIQAIKVGGKQIIITTIMCVNLKVTIDLGTLIPGSVVRARIDTRIDIIQIAISHQGTIQPFTEIRKAETLTGGTTLET